MSVIDVQNLTFSYDGGTREIFSHVSFRLDTDWKLGLVGRNGRGKTTFLRLLTGQYEYSGKISASMDFTYFPFDVLAPHRPTDEILRDVCPTAEDWEILREFSYLQMGAAVLDRPFDSLSGGERTKVLLAGLFLQSGNFLLIDEPTNHLDANGRQIVSAYLRRKKGFILVSHDRAFLDGCVDHILSINKKNIEIQSGTFSSWLENYERQQMYETAQNERLQKDITRLTEAAKRTANWADKTEASKYGKADSGLKQDRGYVGHKAAKLMKHAKVTEARQQQAIEQKSRLLQNAETTEKLKLFPLAHRSERLLACANLQAVYDGEPIGAPVRLELKRGERVAVNGKNGCGKTSLLRLVAGANIPHTGTLTLASGLIVSYVPQTVDGLTGSLSDFAIASRLDESLFKAMLRKLDFLATDFGCDIAALSQGQKKKILLAKSLCEQAHLYIWDEPLNYIDIYSRLQIEAMLNAAQPTMLFVEHDQAFRDAVATQVVEL